jgi:predicted dithiol-disulfide oxidoreductase (DUF899 family)
MEATMELPQVVSEEEWQRSHEALLKKEKEATRERDALESSSCRTSSRDAGS